MIRIDKDYTEFRDDNDPNYPGGKAVDAPTPDSIEGTPFMARWMNDVNGFRQAVFQRAFGSLDGVSGKPDHVNDSDTLDAITQMVADLIQEARPTDEYTFVIGSNAALAAWANNTPGNDYSRVLVKAGTWEFSIMGVMLGVPLIDISNGRTKSVVGEAGSVIVLSLHSQTFNNVGIRGPVTGELGSLANPGADFFFRNVSIRVVNRVLGGGLPGINTVFDRCANLTNCTVVEGDVPIRNGFDSCINLTNCASTVSSDGDSNGFVNCANLANCVGTGITSSTSAGSSGTGFDNCTNLTNCVGNGGSSSIGAATGFFECANLTNCTGTGNSSSNFGNGGLGTGFSRCSNLTFCVGGASSPNTLATFSFAGFRQCRTGFGNKALNMTPEGGADRCLMAQGSSLPTTNDWANTAAGGWNLVMPILVIPTTDLQPDIGMGEI